MKKFLIVLVIFLLSIVAFACESDNTGNVRDLESSSGQSGSIVSIANSVFLAQEIDIHSSLHFVSGITTHNDRIYYWGLGLDGTVVISIDADGTNLRETRLRTPLPPINFSITDDNHIIVLNEHWQWSEDGEVERTFYYAKYDLNGIEVERRDWGDISPQNSNSFNITGAAITNSGYIAITASCDLAGAVVYLLNPNDETIVELSLNLAHSQEQAIVAIDDSIFVLDIDSDITVLRTIDFNEGSWAAAHPIANVNPTMLRIFNAGVDSTYDILLTTQNYLYAMNLNENSQTIILDWVESDIYYISNEHVASLSDNRIVFLSRFLDATIGEWHSNFFVLSPDSRENLSERTVIALGGLEISPHLRRSVVDFNRRNSDYVIRITEYMTGDWRSYNEAQQRLLIEMLTGTGPDILFGFGISLNTMGQRGFLHDLYTFIDSDDELNRDDFFENVLYALENDDGTLPVISNKFTIETLIGTRCGLGDIDSWTMQDLLVLIESYPQSQDIFSQWMDRESFIQTYIMFSGPELIDWNTYTSNFDSEAFLNILEAAMRLPISTSERLLGWSVADLHVGNILLDYTWISDLARFREYAELLDDVVVPGMPTSGGDVHILDNRHLIGINVNTPHAEIAWEFIRGFLLPTSEIDYGFPLRIDLFEDIINNAMTPKMVLDEETGHLIEVPHLQTWFPSSQSGGYEEVLIYSMEEETGLLLRNIIESAVQRGRFTPEIMNLIMADFNDFASGIRSAEDTARIIQSRVQTWLSEQQLLETR